MGIREQAESMWVTAVLQRHRGSELQSRHPHRGTISDGSRYYQGSLQRGPEAFADDQMNHARGKLENIGSAASRIFWLQ